MKPEKPAVQTLESFLRRVLEDPEAGWNMGGFGAIAEFHHVDEDPPPAKPTGLEMVTTRGGLRIESLAGVRPVAWESVSLDVRRWTHGVSLCLAEKRACLNRRGVLTEIGPDAAALRPQDRDAILFDMGLDRLQVDFCVRTADPDLVAVLREQAGGPLISRGNPAMKAILEKHPHRVALTRLGRVEVFQKIGGPDTGGRSPAGPHTHVLPRLLQTRRSHSANQFVPAGWIPCCGIHPENPVVDRLGNDKALNIDAFDRFQALLRAWGTPDYVHARQVAWHALASGHEPGAALGPDSRAGRAAYRNAIRQYRRINGESLLLHRWAQAFDREDDGDKPEQDGMDETH